MSPRLGIAAATVFATVDLAGSLSGRISPIYLAGALLEVLGLLFLAIGPWPPEGSGQGSS